jgi:dTDP-4-dehydrorhamnose 3,5-epimerase
MSGIERLETRLDGPILIRPPVHGDERGFLLESYRRDALAELGIRDEFVQDNHSRSRRGIVRGIHFAVGAGQAKLVRCVRGSIVDVLVDLRRGSPTYGHWEAYELDDVEMRQLYCPIGFGHGFCVTSDIADVTYKVSSYYDGANERGIAWDDPDVNVSWPVREPLVSDRDRSNPRLRDIADSLPW